ncbi:hypothetical protein D3C72_1254350 [compost metagenome]
MRCNVPIPFPILVVQPELQPITNGLVDPNRIHEQTTFVSTFCWSSPSDVVHRDLTFSSRVETIRHFICSQLVSQCHTELLTNFSSYVVTQTQQFHCTTINSLTVFLTITVMNQTSHWQSFNSNVQWELNDLRIGCTDPRGVNGDTFNVTLRCIWLTNSLRVHNDQLSNRQLFTVSSVSYQSNAFAIWQINRGVTSHWYSNTMLISSTRQHTW